MKLALERGKQLTEMAEYITIEEHITLEINELIKEIDRELSFTQAGNKKLLDGSFPYIAKMNLETLGIQNISSKTEEEITNAKTKIAEAIQKLTNLESKITVIEGELQSKQDQEADKGYAFEIDNTKTTPTVEIEEKDKDKFQIINGELTYIGNNQSEKQWALEMDIKVLNK